MAFFDIALRNAGTGFNISLAAPAVSTVLLVVQDSSHLHAATPPATTYIKGEENPTKADLVKITTFGWHIDVGQALTNHRFTFWAKRVGNPTGNLMVYNGVAGSGDTPEAYFLNRNALRSTVALSTISTSEWTPIVLNFDIPHPYESGDAGKWLGVVCKFSGSLDGSNHVIIANTTGTPNNATGVVSWNWSGSWSVEATNKYLCSISSPYDLRTAPSYATKLYFGNQSAADVIKLTKITTSTKAVTIGTANVWDSWAEYISDVGVPNNAAWQSGAAEVVFKVNSDSFLYRWRFAASLIRFNVSNLEETLLYSDGNGADRFHGGSSLDGKFLRFLIPSKTWAAGSVNDRIKLRLYCQRDSQSGTVTFDVGDEASIYTHVVVTAASTLLVVQDASHLHVATPPATTYIKGEENPTKADLVKTTKFGWSIDVGQALTNHRFTFWAKRVGNPTGNLTVHNGIAPSGSNPETYPFSPTASRSTIALSTISTSVWTPIVLNFDIPHPYEANDTWRWLTVLCKFSGSLDGSNHIIIANSTGTPNNFTNVASWGFSGSWSADATNKYLCSISSPYDLFTAPSYATKLYFGNQSAADVIKLTKITTSTKAVTLGTQEFWDSWAEYISDAGVPNNAAWQSGAAEVVFKINSDSFLYRWRFAASLIRFNVSNLEETLLYATYDSNDKFHIGSSLDGKFLRFLIPSKTWAAGSVNDRIKLRLYCQRDDAAGTVTFDVGDEASIYTHVVVTAASTLLVVQDASHLHTVANVALTQKQLLAVQNSSHLHTAANVALTQKQLLVVQDASHLHTAANVVLDVRSGPLADMHTDAVWRALNNSKGSASWNDTTEELSISARGGKVGSTYGNIDNVVSVFRQITGDFDVSCYIPEISDAWNIRDATAGIQCRESLNENSINYGAEVWYAEDTDRWAGQNEIYRATTGGAITLNYTSGTTNETYLRLRRVGNVFTIFWDTVADGGASWTQVYQSTLANMPTTCYVGFHGFANDPTFAASASLDVLIKNITGWLPVTNVVLTVQNSSHLHTAETPTLTQKQLLVVQDASHLHTSENAVLTQKQLLAVQNSSHGHTADSPVLVQDYQATVQSSSHTHTAGSPTLTQKHLLSTQNSAHLHTSASPTLTQKHLLIAQNSGHLHTSASPTLIQKYTLVAQSSSHLHTAASPTVIQKHLLVAQNSSHLHTSENVALIQKYTLAVQGSSHSHTVTAPILTQKHTLAVQNSAHLHTAENVTLVITAGSTTLIVANSSHLHTAANVTVTQKHLLGVQNSSHLHLVENVTVIRKFILVLQDSSHVHTSATPTLTQKHFLGVQNSSHLHTAENVTVIRKFILVLQDSSHLHTAASPTLLQKSTLVVQNSSHLHTAANVTVIRKFILQPQNSSHLHTAANVTTVQKYTLVVQNSSHLHTVPNVTVERKIFVLPNNSSHAHTASNVQLDYGAFLLVQDSYHRHLVSDVTLSSYLLKEATMVAKFKSGDVVNIKIYDLTTNALVIDANTTEMLGLGYFKYFHQGQVDPAREYLYIMTNGTIEQSGRLTFKLGEPVGDVSSVVITNLEEKEDLKNHVTAMSQI